MKIPYLVYRNIRDNVMKNNNHPQFFKGSDHKIGGLYPNVKACFMWYDELLACQEDTGLYGLTPEGFNGSETPCDPFSFDLGKVLELSETILLYLVSCPLSEKQAEYEEVLPLLKALHSAPESNCKGEILPGELYLAMRLNHIEIRSSRVSPMNWRFGLDLDSAYDANTYIDDEHGFENLLRPCPRVAVTA